MTLIIGKARTTRTQVDPVRQELALLRAEYGELLAHARAAVAAARDGEPEPTSYLLGLLEEHGQVPRPDQSPTYLAAQAWIPGGELS
jgi:hypothetical protein